MRNEGGQVKPARDRFPGGAEPQICVWRGLSKTVGKSNHSTVGDA